MSDVKKPLNKKVIIIVSAVVAALLIALIPIIIMLATPDAPPEVDVPDTGETFEGVYTLNMLSAGAPATSSYEFKEGGKVTVTYNVGEGDVTTDYTYKIAIESGNKVIKLTPENGGTVETLGFASGKETLNYDVCDTCTYDRITGELDEEHDGCNGTVNLVTRTRQYVSVNDSMYYKEITEE